VSRTPIYASCLRLGRYSSLGCRMRRRPSSTFPVATFLIAGRRTSNLMRRTCPAPLWAVSLRALFSVSAIEVGLNINGISTPGLVQTTLTPTVKWKAYDSEKKGWAFLLGDNMFVPVQNRS
jgi:hypothetical protein